MSITQGTYRCSSYFSAHKLYNATLGSLHDACSLGRLASRTFERCKSF